MMTTTPVVKKVESAKIFNRMVTKNPDAKGIRTKVINEMISKLDMTPGAASTYYANFKNGKWDLSLSNVKKTTAASPSTRSTKPTVAQLSEHTFVELTKMANALTEKPTRYKNKTEVIGVIRKLQK
jgi:hypothetical protein